MGRPKKTPETSRLSLIATVAYARKQRPGGDAAGGGGDGDEADDPPKVDTKPADAKPDDARPDDAAKPADASAPAAEAPETGAPLAGSGAKSAFSNEPPAPIPAVQAEHAGEEPSRSRADTAGMKPQAEVGAPPEVPTTVAPPMSTMVEEQALMPGPREVPSGNPDDPAAPPGRVPPGDSRSLRRRGDPEAFALVYRIGTFVISRFGTVGTRGQWRVVEYPTSASASHSYAKECSRFVAEGFSDYRD
ncbi:MAG: hypothetical protein H0T89_28365 [Deltaproteobacteria bacterium]|nr:hypothetical protein [Deltaproteobacteria bacterium]MDQ3296869.1 hypothetical protein [Myxococcota bacterium]